MSHEQQALTLPPERDMEAIAEGAMELILEILGDDADQGRAIIDSKYELSGAVVIKRCEAWVRMFSEPVTQDSFSVAYRTHHLAYMIAMYLLPHSNMNLRDYYLDPAFTPEKGYADAHRFLASHPTVAGLVDAFTDIDIDPEHRHATLVEAVAGLTLMHFDDYERYMHDASVKAAENRQFMAIIENAVGPDTPGKSL